MTGEGDHQLVDLFTLLDSGLPRGREAAPAGAAA